MSDLWLFGECLVESAFWLGLKDMVIAVLERLDRD